MKVSDCSGPEFFLAVYDVFSENGGDDGTGRTPPEHKAASERWTANSIFRRQLWERVRDRYCERTGCKPWCFWFSEDGVAEAYLRWRKETASGREAMLAELRVDALC